MNNLSKLLLGEIKRLIKYKILPVSIVTSFIWILIFIFLNKAEALKIAPLLIFVDISMMSILLISASNFLERQDGTIKTIMVLPVSLLEILLSKIISSLFLTFISAFITSLALYFIHSVVFNYGLLFIFIVITGIIHIIIGFWFSQISKDFTSMLGVFLMYLFPFTVPTILFSFGIINERYEWLLMISPAHSSHHLITSSIIESYDLGKIIFSSIYLILLSLILIKFVVYPKFKENAVRL